MLSKFFQSFNEKEEKNEDHSFESDLYNLIYEIIIADHEITDQEINLASELVEYYFKIPTLNNNCLLYTSPSPRDNGRSRMPSSA